MKRGWSVGELLPDLGWVLAGPPAGDRGAALAVDLGPVVIDAREARGGTFIALQGTRTHGLEYWQQAQDAGAAAIVAPRDAPAELVAGALAGARVPLVLAERDGFATMAALGRAWRRRCGFIVVGITGSTGKTSTKDLLHAVLSGHRRVIASHANRNNEIGVPLTLLSATAEVDVVICEMGMRGLGQVAHLCSVAEPDIGIVTNAGTAHLELLGTVENIARAKAELLAAVAAGTPGGAGIGVAPEDQPELLVYAGADRARVLTFGPERNADCRILSATRAEGGIAGQFEIRGVELAFELPVYGLHQARNLAAAVAAAAAVLEPGELAGLSLRDAGVGLTEGRGNRHRLADGTLVIDDAYNANPESMRAAIAELEAVDAGRRVAVLGYMAELGTTSRELHRQLGQLVADSTIDALVVVDTQPEAREYAELFERGRGVEVRMYATAGETVAATGEWLRAGDAVLVKASNSVGLGRLVEALVRRDSGR